MVGGAGACQKFTECTVEEFFTEVTEDLEERKMKNTDSHK